MLVCTTLNKLHKFHLWEGLGLLWSGPGASLVLANHTNGAIAIGKSEHILISASQGEHFVWHFISYENVHVCAFHISTISISLMGIQFPFCVCVWVLMWVCCLWWLGTSFLMFQCRHSERRVRHSHHQSHFKHFHSNKGLYSSGYI